IVGAAHATAYRERHEHLLRRATHHVEHRLALARGRGDVEEGDLVRTLRAIASSKLHGVASVTQVLEVHALDHAAGIDVEARDHTYRSAHQSTGFHTSRMSTTNTSVPSSG